MIIYYPTCCSLVCFFYERCCVRPLDGLRGSSLRFLTTKPGDPRRAAARRAMRNARMAKSYNFIIYALTEIMNKYFTFRTGSCLGTSGFVASIGGKRREEPRSPPARQALACMVTWCHVLIQYWRCSWRRGATLRPCYGPLFPHWRRRRPKTVIADGSYHARIWIA